MKQSWIDTVNNYSFSHRITITDQKIAIVEYSRRKRYIIVDNVMCQDPNPKSRANYLLLRQQMIENDETIITGKTYRRGLQTLRKRIINNNQDALICHWCGHGLKKDIEVRSSSQKVTIDHIVRITDGGKIFDDKNIVTACRTCNNGRHQFSVSKKNKL